MVYDAENDSIIYNAISDTNSFEAYFIEQTLFLTPDTNWNGIANVTVTASDGELIDTMTFNVEVIPVNDAPVMMTAISDTSFYEDDSLLITLEAFDIDSDSIFFYEHCFA